MVDAWSSSRRVVEQPARSRRGVMLTSCRQEESQRRHSAHTTADGQAATRRPLPAADAGAVDEMTAADHEGDQDRKHRRARHGQKAMLKASPRTLRIHSISLTACHRRPWHQ